MNFSRIFILFLLFFCFENIIFANKNTIFLEDTIKVILGNSLKLDIIALDSTEIINNKEEILIQLAKIFQQIENAKFQSFPENNSFIKNDSSFNIENQKEPIITLKNKILEKNFSDHFEEDDDNLFKKYINRFKKEDLDYSYKFIRYILFFELGFTNFLEQGHFPNENNQQYSSKPLGSINIGFGGNLRLRFTQPFSLNLEYGLTWHNYRFQDKSTILSKEGDGVEFSQRLIENTENYEFNKSRLSVPYMNLSIIPMFHIIKIDYSSKSNFKIFKMKIGVGVFGGYRIGGNMKYQYEVDNVRIKYKNQSDFFINSYHYGVKAILGFGNYIDIYCTYDLNYLFSKNKGPELNTISLGIRLNL
ncbi:MAG: hypothetical protein LBV69_05115 [Bacteroidales bacterium]|jgi:hypothetical protein|nr:hypothetical protein [Bacteroidales bacterium]